MAIFNSLGSNYNLAYALKSLWTIGAEEDLRKLKDLLVKKYGGDTRLFYKGREALTYALEVMDLPQDSEIAINGFTCVAVFNAIRKAGYEPACLDLEKKSNLNFSSKTLEDCLRRNKKIKAVIVQNTLGYPCDIEKIKRICRENSLILIEDLAHSAGTKYLNGEDAGTVGDFVVLSFSQDKIIDAVSGGALIIRDKNYKSASNIGYKKSNPTRREKFYPLLTYAIRTLYGLSFGKFLHYVFKKANLMSDIMNESYYDFYLLPYWNAAMTRVMYKNLEKQLGHRRKIARIYASNLSSEMLLLPRTDIEQQIIHSSNLRFPIFVKNRKEILLYLKKRGIYLSDIWYHEVAPECKTAVSVSKKILNLPTHINMTENRAIRICEILNNGIKNN